jgi:hypothetical protein
LKPAILKPVILKPAMLKPAMLKPAMLKPAILKQGNIIIFFLQENVLTNVIFRKVLYIKMNIRGAKSNDGR